MMLLAGFVTLIVLVWPVDALAWGPVAPSCTARTLADLAVITGLLRDLLSTHRLPYLYGASPRHLPREEVHAEPLYALPLLAGRLADRRSGVG
jgi:hypothetical protein